MHPKSHGAGGRVNLCGVPGFAVCLTAGRLCFDIRLMGVYYAPSHLTQPKIMTALTASFVDIENRPADAAAASAPAAIGGHNLFTGDLPRGIMNGILRITNDMEWGQTWRVNLKREPPAPLPEGAEAQVYLSASKDSIHVTPQNLRFEGNQLHIEWLRVHMGRDDLPEDAQAPSRFAVLLTPKVTCNHSFVDMDGHAREKWQQALEQERRIITEGIPRDVTLLPSLKIFPRHIPR